LTKQEISVSKSSANKIKDVLIDEIGKVYTWEDFEYVLCWDMEALNKIINQFA